MIQLVKSWIIEISTVVLFITAVEMLLPNNSLKKYSKFVLGLILMTVLINPLIKLFNNNFDIDVYSQSISNVMEDKSYEKNLNEYREKTVNSTIENFQNNLDSIITEKLKKKFPSGKYTVCTKVNFNEKTNNFTIKKINIEVKDKRVTKIKKVNITLGKKHINSNEDTQYSDIKSYLKDELGIEENIITIYKV